jgi:hypothetical protein
MNLINTYGVVALPSSAEETPEALEKATKKSRKGGK